MTNSTRIRYALQTSGLTRRSTQPGSPPSGQTEQAASTPRSWPWGATITALVALVLISAAAYARFNPQAIERMMGGPTFDHSVFDALLKEHVDENGWVDYAALQEDADRLDRYIEALAEAPFDEMGRNEKLALLINAYNAFTLRLILDYWDGGQLRSIKTIPSEKRWSDRRWKVGSHRWSLNQIEHEQIRPKFMEPRVHFALVCAAVGCPILRSEVYQADRIDEQLDAQARYVHTHGRWFRFDAERDVVHLTKLYDWYGSDFEQVAGTVLDFAARYSPPLKSALDAGRKPKLKWLEYDWKLNGRKNAR